MCENNEYIKQLITVLYILFLEQVPRDSQSDCKLRKNEIRKNIFKKIV